MVTALLRGSLISANSYNRSTSPKYFLSEYLRSPNSSSVSNSWKKAQQEKWHNRKHFSSSPKKLNGISDDVAHLSYICHKASAQISATVNSQEPQIWEKLAHIAIDHLNTSLSSHKSTCIFIISIKISWSSPSFSLNPSKIYTAASVKHSWCINFKLLSRSNFGQKSLVIL